MREKQNYYCQYSDRRSHRKNPLKVAIGLIVFALLIVGATRISASEPLQVPHSYGAQSIISANKDNLGLDMVSQFDVPPGTQIDEYRGIVVYSNGTNYMSSHGLNFSDDGYYYGYKWQCVEYVKRFYYEIYGHKMPDGAGNAKFFYNPMLNQGELNEQRGLLQFKNGGDVRPLLGDLLVFTDGAYGHVAIIAAMGQGWVEVIQQNSEVPRERYEIRNENGKYTIVGDKEPAGWLRK